MEEEEYNQGEINAVTNAIDNVYKISDKYYKKNYSRWEIHCIYIVSLITFVVLFFQNPKINALYLAIGAVFVGGLFGGVAGAFLDERFGTMKRGVKYWLICMIASCAVVGVLALLLFLSGKYNE